MFLSKNIWFLNSFLVIFLLSVISYLSFIHVQKEDRHIIKKVLVDDSIIIQKEPPKMKSILEKDVFVSLPVIPVDEQRVHGSYYPQTQSIQIPQIPSDLPIEEMEEQIQDFLPPLQVSLKGTIISNNPKYNRAFVENMRSKEEKSCMVGDIIEDAQIVSIEKSKIILVRSNGQQETLYLNSISAQEEKSYNKIPWSKIVVEDEEEGSYSIDVRLLKKRISTPGHFFDELDLVTSFEKGLPVGCKVGRQEHDSLVLALGLVVNDIIVSVDGIGCAVAEDRAQIYEKLFKIDYENEPSSIEVVVKRNNTMVYYVYNLFASTVQQYKKSLGILMPDQEENNDAKDKKLTMEDYFKKSSLNEEKIHDMLNKEDNKSLVKGGKKYAYYRK
jgi:type II secretory pathway component PulC